MSLNDAELLRRSQADLEDRYDEELELEDRNVDAVATTLTGDASGPDRGTRRRCLRELFRLQRELVTRQDRVQRSGHEVVILFVGHGALGRTAPRQELMLERTHIAEAP
jgi:polyphosphate kinase 2 (PPK2 family)